MQASTADPVDSSSGDFAGTWRYKVGLGMIIIGHVGLLAGMILPLLGLRAALAGVLIVAGEVLSFSSIVFLGKAGFMAIKKKIFGAVKARYAGPIGPARHYFGIGLLLVCMLTTYTTALYAWTAFATATPENPMPVIWGLDFAQQGTMVVLLFVIGEISILAGIYVLGADWWERVRNAVVWKAQEE